MVLLKNLQPPTGGVRLQQADTAAVLDGLRLGSGTLYVTEARLSWFDGSGMGFSLDYPTIGLHAISRDVSAFPQEHLYVMVNGKLSGKVRMRQKWQRNQLMMKTKKKMAAAAVVMRAKKDQSQRSDLCPATRQHWSPCSQRCASARRCTPTQKTTTLTTTSKEKSMTWRRPSTAMQTSRPSTLVTRVCQRSRRRARPRWRGWRECWPRAFLSSTTWQESGLRRAKLNMKMVWRWMQQRWRPVSLRMQMLSTDGVHLSSQSKHWSCIMGLEGRTEAVLSALSSLVLSSRIPVVFSLSG